MAKTGRIPQAAVVPKAVRWYACLICTAYLLVVFLNHIKGDDIVYSIILGRYWIEDGQRLFVFPHCRSGYLISPPLIWRLPSMLLASLYGLIQSHIGLRLLGIFLLAANALLLFTLSTTGAKTEEKKELIQQFLFYALFFGAFPFFFGIVRPENYLLLLSGLILLLGARAAQSEQQHHFVFRLLMSMLQLFICTLAFSIHPVALCLTLIFAYALLLVPHDVLVRTLLMLILLGFAAISFQTHKSIIHCPENSLVESFMQVYAGKQRSLSEAPMAFLLERIDSTLRMREYLWSLFVYDESMLDIRPHLPKAPPFLLHITRLFISLGLTLLGTMTLYILLALVKERKEVNWRLLVGPLLGLVTLAVLSASQKEKFAYRLLLFYPVFLLVFCQLWNQLQPEKVGSLQILSFQRLLRGFCYSSLLSASCLLMLYASPADIMQRLFVHKAHTSGLFALQVLEDDIKRAKQACGLTTSSQTEGLLIDTTTYYHAGQSRSVSNLEYLLNGVHNPKEAVESIKEFGADGMLVLCESIPENVKEVLAARLIRSGAICCHPGFSP